MIGFSRTKSSPRVAVFAGAVVAICKNSSNIFQVHGMDLFLLSVSVVWMIISYGCRIVLSNLRFFSSKPSRYEAIPPAPSCDCTSPIREHYTATKCKINYEQVLMGSLYEFSDHNRPPLSSPGSTDVISTLRWASAG
jgi:hypothetical protein